MVAPNPFSDIGRDLFGDSDVPEPVTPFSDIGRDLFQNRQRPSETDDTQNIAEKSHDDRQIKFDAAFPGIDADTERLRANLHSNFRDAPMPQSYPEALREIFKRHGVEYAPNPAISGEIEQLADKLAWMQLSQSGLIDETGPRAGLDAKVVDRLRGAYLYNLTTLYSNLAPEENQRVNQRAVQRLGSFMTERIQSQMLELTQERDDALINKSISGDEEARLRLEVAQSRLELAQQDFATARELMSRAGEDKVQSWFLGTAYDAINQLKRTSPADTDIEDRNAILLGVLDAPFTEAKHGGFPEQARGKGPMAERFHGLMERHLKLTDPTTGRARGFAMSRAIQLAYRGSLVEERLDMLGISSELAQNMSPGAIAVHTHPGVVSDLARIKIINEGKNFIANKEGKPLAEVPSLDAKLSEWIEGNGARIADELIGFGMAPLRELQNELDASARTGLDAFKDSLDSTIEEVGAYIMSGSDDLGDAIGRAQEFYGILTGELDPRTAAVIETIRSQPEFQAASTALGIGAMANSAAERIDRAVEEGEQDAMLAKEPDVRMTHDNKWLSDIDQLTQQVKEDNRTRLGLTREASERIFNTKGNSLRQGAMWLADEIAAITAEQYVPLGFHPETIRMGFRQLRSKEFSQRLDDSILRGTTEEEFEDFANLVRKRRAERGISVLDTLALGAMQLGRDIRATTQLLMEEPDDLVNIAAVGTGTGYMGNMFLRGVKNQTTNRLARMFTMHRARIIVNNALRTNPDAVMNMRKVLTRMQGKGPGAGQRHAAVEAATDALDYITDTRNLVTEATPDLKNQRLLRWLDGQTKKASQTASEIIRHLDPDDLDTLLDDFKLDGVTRHWIRNSGLFRTLREVVRDRFQFRLGDKSMRYRSGSSPRLLFDSIENNPAADLASLPFNPEALTAESLPFWSRVFPGRQADIAQARAVREALDWMADYKKDTLLVRGFAAEARSNLEGWTQYMRTVEANRLRKIAAWRVAAEGSPLAGERLQRLQQLRAASLGRVQRSRAARDELLDRTFDDQLQGLASPDHPLFEDYTPEQVLAYLQVRHGRHQVYDRLRGVFESEESFWGRVSEMGRRFDKESGKLEADAAKLKSQMIREFFQSPGLLDKQRFDLLDGFISDRRLARNLRERRAIGEGFLREEMADLRDKLPEADQSLLDDLLRTYEGELDKLEKGQISDVLLGEFRTRKNLKQEWEEIKRRATSERANRLVTVKGISGAAEWGSMFEVATRINDGRLRGNIQDAKNLGMQQRLLARAYTAKVDNIQAFFDKLTNPEKQLFNTMMTIARDEGIEAPLGQLRKRFPEYFDMVAPETDDVAVQHLWNRIDSFRKGFLKDLADTGLIDKATFDKLIGPYAPRLFSADLLPRLYGTDGADLWAKPSRNLGISLGALESQRHTTKFKAQIYARGGRPITRKFDTSQEAIDWVDRNYGVQGRAVKESEGAVSGSTQAGTKFAILDPLGDEARDLGADLIGPGEGMFVRMRELTSDMLQIRYFNQFDRKGIALNDAEFQRIELERGKEYIKLGDSPKFGALSGKFVHKNVFRQLEEYSSARSIQDTISGALESEVMVTATDAGSLLRATGGLVIKSSNVLKQGIMYNGIARNPATQIGNFLSDAMYFARAAAGSGLNTTVDGFKHSIDAWRAIRGLRRGKVTIDDLPFDVRRGMELGVVDDQIFGSAGLGNRRLRDIEAVFGKLTPFQAFISPLRDARIRKPMEREAAVDRLLLDEDLPAGKRARLVREKMALRQVTESNMGTMAKIWARNVNLMRSFVGVRKGRFQDIESASANFYGEIGNLNRMRAYLYMVRNRGFSPEAAAMRVNKFMQTYSRVSLNPIGKQLQRFGRTPLGSPIVSFPFELVRINLNLIRENPAFLAGFLMSGVARNMMSIAATGSDPYRALEQMAGDSNLPMWATLAGKQYIPLPNQQNLVVSNPALSIYEQFFNNMGFLNGAVNAWEDYGDETALSQIMRTGTQVLSNFAVSSPMINFTASTLAKRDSFTGERRRDGYELLGDNFARMLQPLVHPYYPIIGLHAQKLEKVKKGFPHAYSQREHSMFNKMLEITGFRVKGDVSAFLDALPEGLADPAKDLALRATKAHAFLFLWDDVPEERLLGQGRGLDTRDYLALVIAKSAYLDEQNGGDMQGAREKSLTQMRTALRMLRDDDPVVKRQGADLLDEAETSLRELFSTREQVGFLGAREATDKEVRNVVARMLELGDGYNNALETMSVLRRAGVISKMAMTKDVPDDMMENLFRQFILTRNGGLRGPTGADELEQVADYLDRALRSGVVSDSNMRRLNLMRQIVESWIPQAEVREFIENETIEKYRRAQAIMEEARRVRQ